MDWENYFVCNPKDSRLKIYNVNCGGTVLILKFEMCCSSSAASQIQGWVSTLGLQCFLSLVISSEDQVFQNTGYSWMSWHWFGWSVWDPLKLNLKVGFICPFVVINLTNFGTTMVVALALQWWLQPSCTRPRPCAWCPSTYQCYHSLRIPVFLPMVKKLVCSPQVNWSDHDANITALITLQHY